MPQTIQLTDENVLWLQPVGDSLGATIEDVVHHVLLKHRPFDESQFDIPTATDAPVDPAE